MHESFNAGAILDDLLLKGNTKCNVFMGVPTMYVKLLEEIEKRNLKEIDLDKFRLIGLVYNFCDRDS